MPTPDEERKQMEQAAWLVVVLIAFMMLLVFAGVIDQWFFAGELFGRK